MNIAFQGNGWFSGPSNLSMNTLVAANISCLEQGLAFLGNLPAGLYTDSCPELFNSSIGGHIRHNLDHYSAFLNGYGAGNVDYDKRDRDSEVESDPEVAIRLMLEIRKQLEEIPEEDDGRLIRSRMDDGGDSGWSETSVRRELQFLLSHTIHHYALIVSLAVRHGMVDFPKGFGVAPSTLNYKLAQGA